MTAQSNSTTRARRIRNALLASVFTVGIAGAAGTGILFTDSHVALADQVKVDAPAPADFTAVVEKVRPAVVSVQVETETRPVLSRRFEDFRGDIPEFFRRFGLPFGFDGPDFERGPRPHQPRRGVSQGSGFFISEDGYVVTNAHVVRDGRQYTVITDDGRELDAKVIGTDDRTDLALLKVKGNDFTYLSFSEAEPKVGQWVLAMGDPFGLGGSVSAGILSALHRDIGTGPYDNYLQVDAPVNRGNSGGPVFNTRGEVVGVATAIFSPSGGNVGIAFAIPANIVSEVVGDLQDDGSVTRGWLGVAIQPVTDNIAKSLGIESNDGVVVAGAEEDGPARGVGIRAGDVITEVNGEAVTDPKQLSRMIARLEPGETITVTVLRDGSPRDFSVTLGDLNDYDEMRQASVGDRDQDDEEPGRVNSVADLGLTLEDNPDGDGVRVVGVEDGSPAAESGIRAGSVIVGILGEGGLQDVKSPRDLEDGLAAARDLGRSAVTLSVERGRGAPANLIGVPLNRG